MRYFFLEDVLKSVGWIALSCEKWGMLKAQVKKKKFGFYRHFPAKYGVKVLDEGKRKNRTKSDNASTFLVFMMMIKGLQKKRPLPLFEQ